MRLSWTVKSIVLETFVSPIELGLCRSLPDDIDKVLVSPFLDYPNYLHRGIVNPRELSMLPGLYNQLDQDFMSFGERRV